MRFLSAILLLTLGCATAQQQPRAAAPVIDLPAQVITLENGLTLVMQRDMSMPQVGVEVWIRGGAREEAAGQYGIAHLFEHNVPLSGRFMSNPENRALRGAASRGGGAGTQADFLRFYSNSSPEGLEATLAFYADRLESDQAKFSDESVRRDQDIVISELRRAMGADWDIDVQGLLHRGTYGADHPYGHAISGLEADVRAATAETMRDWHRRFSGASNAIVFVIGNFEPAQAEQLVRRHYGSIPPGRRAPLPGEDVPHVRPRRDTIEKPVARDVVYIQWPVPAWGSADADVLTLFARIAGAEVEAMELASTFTLRGEAEAPLRATLARLLRDGITEAELARAKAQLQTEFVRTLQRPVWRGSRADVLGFGLMWRGDVDHYKTQLARIAGATPAAVHEAARRWLSSPGYTLHVVPQPKRVAVTPPVDRTATVAKLEARPLEFPAISIADNVLKAERNALPLAQLTFAYDRGTDVEALRERVASRLADFGATVETANDPDFALLHLLVLSRYASEAARIVAAEKPSAVEREDQPKTAIQRRDRALECLVADCTTTPRGSTAPRFFLASGGVRNVRAGLGLNTSAAAPVILKAPEREHFQLVDYPAATQAYILLAQVLPPAVAKDPLAAHLVVSYILRQRLMENLRTSKGWSYEVYPFGIELRRGAALARFNIPVQTGKTAESIQEIRNEIARLQNEPLAPTELAGVQAYLESSLTGGLMSLEQMNAQLLELARNDLPADYYPNAVRRLAAFTPSEVQAAARELFTPERLIWIIAGPRAELESELRELGVEVNSIE
jgi:predicted Zn-dependent peptidase